jgi:hypothetical protein
MVVQGHPYHPPVCVPVPAQRVHVKKYKLLEGHDEITGTIAELEKAKIICSLHVLYNSPLWPVWNMAHD